MNIYYQLNQRGTRKDRTLLCIEDKPFNVIFDIPLKYRKWKLTAYFNKITSVLNDCTALIPDKAIIIPDTVKMTVRAEFAGKTAVLWECDPIQFESEKIIYDKFIGLFPEYKLMPKNLTELTAKVKLLTDVINNNYAPLLVKMNDRINKIEADFDPLNI